MEPKDKEIIDLDFDPDILANYLEKLNLETGIPKSLNEAEINYLSLNFEEDCSIKQFSDEENSKIEVCLNENTENKEIDFIKKENDDDILDLISFNPGQLTSEDEKPISDSIKNKIYVSDCKSSFDNKNFKTDTNVEENSPCSILLKDKNVSPILLKTEILEIQSENLTDSDTDEDDLNLIYVRGPDRHKKRYKRKQFEQSRLNRNTDGSSLDQQRLLFLSSGHIISNYDHNIFTGNNKPQLQTHAITNFDCTNTNDSSVGSPGESGYETSQSSSLYSPLSNGRYSPVSPNVGHLQVSNTLETSEDEAFVDFILELGEAIESSNIGTKDCNIPIWDDNDCNYIEKLKNYLKEASDDQLQQSTQNGEVLEHASAETSLAAVSPEIASKSLNKPVLKSKGDKLCFKLNDIAKYLLRYSKSFDEDKYFNEQRFLFKKIQDKEKREKNFKIIEYEEVEENANESIRLSNLHSAVLNSNIEKVYCLVEAMKRYNHSLFDINIRDSRGRTPLDYAVDEEIPELNASHRKLIIDYLKENKAVQGIEC